MSLPDLYYVTVSISAVAATAAFIISVVGQIYERRNLAILKWQRAVVQQIFQNASRVLSFDEIAQRYRNEAVGYRNYNLKADELSPQALRLVLLQMIKEDILEQRREDKYSLKSFDSGIEAQKEAQSELMNIQIKAMGALQQSSAASMTSIMKDQIQGKGYTARTSDQDNFVLRSVFLITTTPMYLRFRLQQLPVGWIRQTQRAVR